MKQSSYIFFAVLLLGLLMYVFLRRNLHTGEDVRDTAAACKNLRMLVSGNSVLSATENGNLVMMRVRHGWVELCIKNSNENDQKVILDIATKEKSRITQKDLHIVFLNSGMAVISDAWIRR